MKLHKVFLLVIMLVCMPLSAASQEKRYSIPIGDSPSLGSENARVTIVEFIDFQ